MQTGRWSGPEALHSIARPLGKAAMRPASSMRNPASGGDSGVSSFPRTICSYARPLRRPSREPPASNTAASPIVCAEAGRAPVCNGSVRTAGQVSEASHGRGIQKPSTLSHVSDAPAFASIAEPVQLPGVMRSCSVSGSGPQAQVAKPSPSPAAGSADAGPSHPKGTRTAKLRPTNGSVDDGCVPSAYAAAACPAALTRSPRVKAGSGAGTAGATFSARFVGASV